jgi:hypothetical protein
MQLTQPTLTQSPTPSVHFSQALFPIASVSTPSLPLTESQSHALQVARQSLLTSDKPHLLKVISYLRISCSVMRARRQGLQSASVSATSPGIKFSGLMQSLYAYDSEWWKHCQVTVTGQLTSNDAVIAQLLQPINAFHLL